MRNFVKSPVIVSRDSRAIDLYMRDVARYPLLTPAEEAALACEAHAGNSEARQKLLTSNLRFVLTVAHAYQGQGVPLADLISEGNIGLQKAVDLFDPTRGFRFCSYAVWWIRQSITQAISLQSRAIRIPSNRQALLSKVSKARAHLMQTLQRNPTDAEVAHHLGVDVDTVGVVERASARILSTEASLSSDDETPLSEVLASSQPQPDHALEQESLANDLDTLLSCLPPTERTIVERHYGLGGTTETSLNTLALQLKLSQERVRQLHRSALSRIRRHPLASQLVTYLP